MTGQIDSMKNELTLDATLENLDAVQSFIAQRLEAADCPIKTQMQVEVVVEEVFVNIAQYAYVPGRVRRPSAWSFPGTPLP